MTVKREPYPTDGFKMFRQQLHLFAHVCGVTKDADVMQAIESLDEAILRRISKNMTKKPKQEDKEAYKFYAIFKHKYLEMTDVEYLGAFDGKDVKLVTGMVQKLEEQGLSVEEYCHWLFDVFFPSNSETLSPNINLARSDKILNTFFFKQKDIIKKRRERKKAEEKEEGLLSRMRVLHRRTNSDEIIQVLRNYKDGKMNLLEFEKIVNLMEKKHQE